MEEANCSRVDKRTAASSLKPLKRFLLSSSSYCGSTSCVSPGPKSKRIKHQQQQEKEVVAVGRDSSLASSSASSSIAKITPVKGQWTEEEDSTLVTLVKQHGVRKWSQIAKMLVGRVGKQCRERWQNNLRPGIKKNGWTEEEERLLVEAHQKLGNKWAEIAKRIPGRSENSIKNHFNATNRRQHNSRKKAASKKKACPPHSSILHDYIMNKATAKSLTSNDNANSSITITTPPCSPTSEIIPYQSILHDISEPTITYEPFSASADHRSFSYEQDLNQPINPGYGCVEYEAYDTTALDYCTAFFDVDYMCIELQDQSSCDHRVIMDSSNGSSCNSSNQINFNSPDAYISYLLNGEQQNMNPRVDVALPAIDPAVSLAFPSACAHSHREMDLIEMVTMSHFDNGDQRRRLGSSDC